MNLIRVTKTYFDVWTELALELWPNEDPEEMREVLIAEYEKPNIRAWLAMENEEYIGFINASLRSDYVPGVRKILLALLRAFIFGQNGGGRAFIAIY